MTVLLRRSSDLPRPDEYDSWAAIDSRRGDLDVARRINELGAALEAAFEAIAETWWALARELRTAPSAWPSHAVAAAPNASDLGVMLAWSQLVESWSKDGSVHLVICDDPWLFRHLAGLPNVRAGVPPRLFVTALRLWVRGVLARIAVAMRAAFAAVRLRAMRRGLAPEMPALLVYGHPGSQPDGRDAYFGTLMHEVPYLMRVLHTDCGPVRARALQGDGRTTSLHAWGRPLHALSLVFKRWTPLPDHIRGPQGWLVRRAAAVENGHGNIAMTHWQEHCQRRWLSAQRPSTVAWPWENHAWERTFVEAARRNKTRTIGYQHSVVGRHMLNYAAHANQHGAAELPDVILCTGAATRDQLARWGAPIDRMVIAGALRFPAGLRTRFDASAPLFVALPFGGRVAMEMISAAQALAAAGWQVTVKDHPMTPSAFDESDNLRRATKPLADIDAVSAVIYAATTVGLEARLAGLPTIRFRSTSGVAIDILPDELDVPTTELQSVVGDVARVVAVGQSGIPERSRFFASVDKSLWPELLARRGIACHHAD